MATTTDRLRERWERLTPGEQRLLAALGITLCFCILFAMVSKVKSGMASLEKENAQARKALRALAVYRTAKARAAEQGKAIKIPEKAVSLDSYLEGIVSELDLKSPTYPTPRENKVGEYIELSFSVEFKELDMRQLSDLLEKIEGGSKLVVVKSLNVDTSFRDREKLDIEFTVATYRRAPKKEEADDAEGSEDGEGEDS